MKLGQPLDLRAGDAGILCLHGFTGTPYEMSFVAKSLFARGFTVSVPLLPGHGTAPVELNRTTWQQWRAAVDDHVGHLRRLCRAVAIVGQSMGGLLALDFAARQPGEIEAVASLAAPLWFEGAAGRLVRGLAVAPRALLRRLGSRDKVGGSDVRDPDVRAANPAYPVLPIAGVVELGRLMASVRRRLGRVRCPLLVVHGRQDHTAPPASAEEILARTTSVDRRLVMVPESYHLVACDVERDRVAAEVGRFLERVL